MNKTIYLVRHCKAEGQAPDARLTREGKEQADRVTAFFKGISVDAILTSPYLRAVDTVRGLAEDHGIPLKEETRLSERVLAGQDQPEWLSMLERTFTDLELSYPGGESSRQAMERGMEVIDDVLQRQHHVTVMATHGNLMALLLKRFDVTFGFTQWKTLSNPDIYRLDFSVEAPVIKRVWK
ncbi:phosphoglycerate mutase [Rossellomorea marisflavi]|uniref:Phosphoglycerate mutase n=1 Tax=Rossellomorea marisflavi TaxID=189381 RepID=A0A0M0FZD5_9BACI|nr:histidine phosphatase family protein [Rossellomorea marisflavi]KON82920.1 phosphoglycerate mutase [Rossellomorea marisflavi]